MWPARVESLDPEAPTLKEATGKEFVSATYRSFMTKKGIPADRLAKLRESFKKAMEDPEFIKEAKKRGLPLGYRTGEALENLTYKFQKICNDFWKKK